MSKVYINKITRFLPNDPVSNEEMERVLGVVGDKPSKARALTLKSNKIKTRYYALKDGKSTHTNAQLAAEAIKKLFKDGFNHEALELIACGTTGPDQLLPSHASMVHGLVGGECEIVTTTGACLTGIQALKYAYMAILCGDKNNAIVTGSERASAYLKSNNYRKEAENLNLIQNNLYLAFEKDFLRWMLSDGAGAVLVENKPNSNAISLQIEWIDIGSFANEVDVCMYIGGMKNEAGQFSGWVDLPQDRWVDEGVFTIKQDIKLLADNVVQFATRFLKKVVEKRKLNLGDIDWYLPHISSYFFYEKLAEEMKYQGVEIPIEKWFTNLDSVGNIGSASIFIMLEELFNAQKLKRGQTVLLMVPESARFSYSYVLLTVV